MPIPHTQLHALYCFVLMGISVYSHKCACACPHTHTACTHTHTHTHSMHAHTHTHTACMHTHTQSEMKAQCMSYLDWRTHQEFSRMAYCTPRSSRFCFTSSTGLRLYMVYTFLVLSLKACTQHTSYTG